ncbi:hypothetical protein IFM89_038534 [Coptis chinensis]|uniref:RNase H type-1 domain-containing protein n=1 Tax=Coptis chinensis TaxID=261450 RepID=A0A835IJT6_9MAGN|nr:hypothetical protein IFM89_038534 [Coptis chinensis]
MLFCAIMDAIWQARNNKRFNGVVASQHSILQQAYRVCQNWIVAFTKPASGSEDTDTGEGASLSSDQNWIKPPPGWNSEGEFLEGKVGRVRANSPGEAEALAAELAVEFALQKQWKEVILEGDARVVIQACRNIEAATSWTWRPPLLYISSLLCHFNSMLFRFTPRICNMSAHTLAKWAGSKRLLTEKEVCNRFLNQLLSNE